jgi:hypothetical protein
MRVLNGKGTDRTASQMNFGLKFEPLTGRHVSPPAQKSCRSVVEGSNPVESSPEAGTNPSVVDWTTRALTEEQKPVFCLLFLSE